MRADVNIPAHRTHTQGHTRMCIYVYIYILLYSIITLPVVPHKAVAEVSKIGNL